MDTGSVVIIVIVFLLAGAVKGVIGLGLPTVSLGLLVVTFDLPTAMVLMLVPSLATNVWQAVVGGNGITIVKRIWPFLLTATVGIGFGALALGRIELPWLSFLLGVLLVLYAGISLTGTRFAISPARVSSTGVVFGLVNGVLTGMTGSFVVPGVMYLQGLGLNRDMLVQAMGMLFTVSTLALAVALGGNGLLSRQFGLVSLAALLPAIIGMIIGMRIRGRIPEHRFRIVFFVSILLLGSCIIVRSLLAG